MHVGTMTEETLQLFDRGAELLVDEEVTLSDEASHRMANDVCANREVAVTFNDMIMTPWSPSLYEFGTFPGSGRTKVGFTMRPVRIRIKEWKESKNGFPNLVWNQDDQWSAIVPNRPDRFIKDFSLHAQLVANGHHQYDVDELAAVGEEGRSREVFEGNISHEELTETLNTVFDNVENNLVPTYSRYDQHKETTKEYLRQHRGTENFGSRHIQLETREAAKRAYEMGRRRLLLAAAPRAGKTMMSLWINLDMGFDFSIVLCGMANAHDEWMKAVLSHRDFLAYEFLDVEDLKNAGGRDLIQAAHDAGKKVILFLTLADFQGELVKEHHRVIFNHVLGGLYVDESHYGARAESFSAKLGGVVEETEAEQIAKISKEVDEFIDNWQLNPLLRIDISGTPYNILASGEYTEKDIICKIRYADMYQAMLDWYIENPDEDETKNPYLGIPQILNYAFCANNKDSALLKAMKDKGLGSLLDLFAPSPLASLHHLMYPELVKKFVKAIFGFEQDSGILSLLNDPKIKDARIGDHQVWAFNYKDVCDGVKEIIKEVFEEHGVADEYKIFAVSSNKEKEPTAEELKNEIAAAEKAGKKTICLTVDRMLTASSVPEWSLMIYAKKGLSAQMYDQNRLRLGTPWITKYTDENGNVCRKVEKQQSIFIDLDPVRMLAIQVEIAHHVARDNRTFDNNESFKTVLEKEYSLMPTYLVDNMEGHFHQVSFEDSMAIASANLFKGHNDIGYLINNIEIDYAMMKDEAFIEQIEKTYKGKTDSSFVYEAKTVEDDEEIEDLGIEVEGSTDDADLDLDDAKIDEDLVETEDSECEIEEVQVADTEENRSLFKEKVVAFYQALTTAGFCADIRLGSLSAFIEYYKRPENIADLDAFGLDIDVLENSFLAKAAPRVIEDFDYTISAASTVRHGNMTVEEKKEQLFGHISNFGTNEVPTPTHIVEKMIGAIGDEELNHIICAGKRILEIGSQTGEYVEYLINFMENAGYSKKTIEKTLAIIPSSRSAGVLVKTLMRMRGYNTDMVASFGMNELHDRIVSSKYDYTSSSKIICQTDKKFNQITLDDVIEKDADMDKFGAVVGNPPYQLSKDDTANKPMYDTFMNLSYKLSDLAVLITPGRFLFNAGNTSTKWNKERLNDPHLSVVKFFPNSRDVFSSIGLPGGIVITKYDANTMVTPITTFTSHEALNSIITKVISHDFVSITSLIHQQNKFDLPVLYADHPEYKVVIGSGGTEKRLTTSIFTQLDVFEETASKKNCVHVYGIVNGSKRISRYIDSKYLLPHSNVDKNKVIVPASNGSPAIGEADSTPLIGMPFVAGLGTGYTQSYIGFGAFETIVEAQHCYKYILSKFARAMLGTRKVTQHNHTSVWANVPLQDFTFNSDIDWTKSIAEIDKQLYKKYGLTQEEIDFIEKNIKPME